MLRSKTIYIVFLLLVLGGTLLTDVRENDKQNKEGEVENIPVPKENLSSVVSVADGDTLSVLDESGKKKTLRLLGIDAPEMSRSSKKAECFAEESHSFLKSAAQGSVYFLYDPQKPRQDIYGRELVYVYTENDIFLNEKILEEGFAFEYFYKKEPYMHRNLFVSKEKEAQKQKKGLWNTSTCDGKKF